MKKTLFLKIRIQQNNADKLDQTMIYYSGMNTKKILRNPIILIGAIF